MYLTWRKLSLWKLFEMPCRHRCQQMPSSDKGKMFCMKQREEHGLLLVKRRGKKEGIGQHSCNCKWQKFNSMWLKGKPRYLVRHGWIQEVKLCHPYLCFLSISWFCFPLSWSTLKQTLHLCWQRWALAMLGWPFYQLSDPRGKSPSLTKSSLKSIPE